jgi:hypothetical protein
MPIKFRCDHCRQFLGISHNKAGTLVDCPTCGRTIRVPDPEGKVQPLPELKLNFKDSKLATALEELASLGRDDAALAEPEFVVELSDKPPAPTIPSDVAALPMAPPPKPVPIRVEPVQAPKPIPIEVHESHKPAPVASMQELSALASLPTARDPATEQPVVDMEIPLGRQATGQMAFKRAGTSRIVIAVLIGFIVGFGAGRWGRTAVKDSNGPGGKPPIDQNATNDRSAGIPKSVAVRGRITFQTESGERRPDRGSRVLLLPAKRSGTTKLFISGFRATDADTQADADSKLAATCLRALGGDVATVDETGNFESTALPPGTYHILALSHFQARNDRAPIEPEVKGLLECYFDKPDQLLGKCRYRLDTVKVSGNEPAPWDHSFEIE